MVLVRERGFEPPRFLGHKILSLARLPVPPLPPGAELSSIIQTFASDAALNRSRCNFASGGGMFTGSTHVL
jgi:hypothetical protein